MSSTDFYHPNIHRFVHSILTYGQCWDYQNYTGNLVSCELNQNYGPINNKSNQCHFNPAKVVLSISAQPFPQSDQSLRWSRRVIGIWLGNLRQGLGSGRVAVAVVVCLFYLLKVFMLVVFVYLIYLLTQNGSYINQLKQFCRLVMKLRVTLNQKYAFLINCSQGRSVLTDFFGMKSLCLIGFCTTILQEEKHDNNEYFSVVLLLVMNRDNSIWKNQVQKGKSRYLLFYSFYDIDGKVKFCYIGLIARPSETVGCQIIIGCYLLYLDMDIGFSLNKLWKDYKNLVQSKFPPKPKKAIEDWDFIMVFEDRYTEQIEIRFSKYLNQSSGNRFKLIKHQKQEEVLVLISINQAQVLRQATELKILKKKNKKSYRFDLKSVNKQIYLAEEDKNEAMCDYLKWIRARMLPGSEHIYEQQKYSVFNYSKKDNYIVEGQKLFTSEQELRTKYNFLVNFSVKQKTTSKHQDEKIYPFTDIMKHAGFKELVAIHKDSKYGSVIFGSIREYVGANSQTYFDFVSFLQRWLIFPAVVGVLTILFNIFFNYTADDSPGDFLYGLVIMIWSIVYITRWEQSEKWTAACEQTGYNDQWTEHQNIIDKRGCRVRESKISGQRELYVPLLQKVWRHCVSIGMCITVLIGTLIFMVLSLNARGFIDERHKFLYSSTISGWAQAGGIFDASTGWGQIPNLIHVLVINVFDEVIYRPLAKKFTKYEQHFQPKSYENSIIVKFFIYEYIITFADLFYIAFVRLDIIGLREQLLSLFFIDIVRRIVAELLIPKLKSKIRKYTMKASELLQQEENNLATEAILEVNKEEYEPFDDYLQIITNFGYLVMISSCFPLAPLLILIAHSIEALQDKYKIVHIFKRKLPSKYVGMGYWKNIMVFICYTSIITNILLFAFSSRQITTIFPKLYESGKDLLYGQIEIHEAVQGAFNIVMDAATVSMQSQQVAQEFSPYQINCPADPPLVKSFMPPSDQYQLQFVSILFVIEHVFLILFLCLRNVLSKQKCEADLLLERRRIKRGIKKYLSREVLGDTFRDTVVTKLFAADETRPDQAFSQLFGFIKSRTQSVSVQGSIKSEETQNTNSLKIE